MASAEDPEAGGINVRALQALSPSIRESIKRADVDGDGVISPEELVQIIHEEQNAVQSSRLLKKIVIALSLLLFFAVASIAGLTYGIVYLTTKTSVGGENVIVSKANGIPMGSAGIINSVGLQSLYQVMDPMDLTGLQHLIVPNEAKGSYRIYQVTAMELVPNESLTLNTTMPGSGSIVIDSTGVHEIVDQLESNITTGGAVGRRLLGAPGAPAVGVIPQNVKMAPGLYVSVVDGVIQLGNKGGTTNFAAGQFGYTGQITTPPVVIPQNPGIQFMPPPMFSSPNAGPNPKQPMHCNKKRRMLGNGYGSIDCVVV